MEKDKNDKRWSRGDILLRLVVLPAILWLVYLVFVILGYSKFSLYNDLIIGVASFGIMLMGFYSRWKWNKISDEEKTADRRIVVVE